MKSVRIKLCNKNFSLLWIQTSHCRQMENIEIKLHNCHCECVSSISLFGYKSVSEQFWTCSFFFFLYFCSIFVFFFMPYWMCVSTPLLIFLYKFIPCSFFETVCYESNMTTSTMLGGGSLVNHPENSVKWLMLVSVSSHSKPSWIRHWSMIQSLDPLDLVKPQDMDIKGGGGGGGGCCIWRH